MIPPRWIPLVQMIASRFREFLREPEVIFWVYGFPLILAVVLGYAFSNKEPTPPRVDVQATPDKARAEAIAQRLRHDDLADKALMVEVLPENDCKERLQKGKTDLYLIVRGKDIEYVYDRTIEDSVKSRYWVEALLSRQYTEGIIGPREEKGPGTKYIQFLLPGLVGINIMGGGLFGVGFVLVDMRVRKLFKRLMATPMRHSDFLLSLLMARLLFLLPEMASLLLVGYFGLGVPIRGSIFTLVLVIVIGAAAFASIGLLLGSRTEKTETMSGFINLLMLPMYLLSGVFFSSKRFPEEAQPFIEALPLTQLNNALRAVMLEGAGLWEVKWPITILLAYAVVSFGLALRWFKWR
jgi:ABC-type multidrug transport system permease subunit